MAGLGVGGVKWTGDGTELDGVVGKILLPALVSPVIAILVAAVGTWLVFRITSGVAERYQQERLPRRAGGLAPHWCPWPTGRTTRRRRWAS